MKNKFLLSTLPPIFGLGSALALGPAARPEPPVIPFDELSMTVEINGTDLDAGLVYLSDTEESVQHLIVQNPQGRTIYQATANDPLGLGITEVTWETAEPDIASVLRDYPEGPYTVIGETFDGKILRGVANVTHKVLPAPQITAPADGAQLHIHDVVISWVLDPRATYYWLEVEADTPALHYNYTIQLPPGTHSFQLPADLLVPNTRYQVGIGAVGANRNASVTVVGFDVLP